MGTELVPVIDLIKDSLNNLLGVSFCKTSSASYPLAVSVARGALKYDELKLDGSTVHMAIFEKSREGASRAMSLLQYISEWKATQIYGGGKLLQNYYRVSEVLRCYLAASACKDYKAHCHMVIDDPFKEPITVTGFRVVMDPYEPKEIKTDRYIFPCVLLHDHFHHRTSEHPSDPKDQIQAVAIDVSYDLCPLFNAQNYELIGQRTTKI